MRSRMFVVGIMLMCCGSNAMAQEPSAEPSLIVSIGGAQPSSNIFKYSRQSALASAYTFPEVFKSTKGMTISIEASVPTSISGVSYVIGGLVFKDVADNGSSGFSSSALQPAGSYIHLRYKASVEGGGFYAGIGATRWIRISEKVRIGPSVQACLAYWNVSQEYSGSENLVVGGATLISSATFNKVGAINSIGARLNASIIFETPVVLFRPSVSALVAGDKEVGSLQNFVFEVGLGVNL